MSPLCFAFLLSQGAAHDSLPPVHVQQLLKSKILYQLKQENLNRQIAFDQAECQVIASYNYVGDYFEIQNTDGSLHLRLPYTSILEGKKLDLSTLNLAFETQENVLAALGGRNQDSLDSGSPAPPQNSIEKKQRKWLPWILGAVGLGLGGWAIYQSTERRGRSAEESDARARRGR